MPKSRAATSHTGRDLSIDPVFSPQLLPLSLLLLMHRDFEYPLERDAPGTFNMPELPDHYETELPVPRLANPRPRSRPAHVEQFAAVIRSSGCSTGNQPDYTDARYYLDRAVPAGNSDASAEFSTQQDKLPGIRQCLTATNLAELASGTHLLPAGSIVQVFALYPRTGSKVYVFNQPPNTAVVVQITGTAGGGGKYNGQILSGSSTASSTGTLAMPEGMGGSTSALILNEEEDGQAGHRIASGAYAVGQLVGNSAGTAIVMIRGALGATTGATTLGNGTGGSVSPDSTAWSRSSNGTPLTVWLQTRTVWDSTGGTLYAYLRSLSFDARGLLISVSGETQITVDVPTACQ